MQGWLSPWLAPAVVAQMCESSQGCSAEVPGGCGRARAPCAAVEAAWDTLGAQAQAAQGSRAELCAFNLPGFVL